MLLSWFAWASTAQAQDADGDGLVDSDELLAHLNPYVADTDRDGIFDHLDADMDGDGIPNEDECRAGGVEGFALENGSFEEPLQAGTGYILLLQDDVPGWGTTAPDEFIELWFGGFLATAADGGQLAELNANYASTLYQDVATAPGDVYLYRFAHQGRDGLDTMRFSLSGVEVTTAADMPGAWGAYGGVIVISDALTSFQFESISSACGASCGNLLDDIAFTPTCDLDTDGDGDPDALDTDSDNDGVPDALDECPGCEDTPDVPDEEDGEDMGEGESEGETGEDTAPHDTSPQETGPWPRDTVSPGSVLDSGAKSQGAQVSPSDAAAQGLAEAPQDGAFHGGWACDSLADHVPRWVVLLLALIAAARRSTAKDVDTYRPPAGRDALLASTPSKRGLRADAVAAWTWAPLSYTQAGHTELLVSSLTEGALRLDAARDHAGLSFDGAYRLSPGLGAGLDDPRLTLHVDAPHFVSALSAEWPLGTAPALLRNNGPVYALELTAGSFQDRWSAFASGRLRTDDPGPEGWDIPQGAYAVGGAFGDHAHRVGFEALVYPLGPAEIAATVAHDAWLLGLTTGLTDAPGTPRLRLVVRRQLAWSKGDEVEGETAPPPILAPLPPPFSPSAEHPSPPVLTPQAAVAADSLGGFLATAPRIKRVEVRVHADLELDSAQALEAVINHLVGKGVRREVIVSLPPVPSDAEGSWVDVVVVEVGDAQ